MATDLIASARELSSRISDGIHVRLLWAHTDDLVFVHVDDRRTGESFAVPIPDGERALDVFEHPYAYAS